MRQVLIVFRKDVKHLWPLAAGMVAILGFHGWVDLQMHHGYLKVISTRIYALEPLFALLAWWCLAGIAVQQESLPGDRQYWLTRPIPRQAILAAKALFLAVFVCLPNFLAQVIVLGATGFPPGNYLGALVRNQAFIGVYLVLAASLASVTRGFRQYILTSLAVGAIVVSSIIRVPGNGGIDWGGVEWARTWALQLELLAGGIVVLTLQYAWRRTLGARLVLGGSLIMGLLVLSLGWYHYAFALTAALGPGQDASPQVGVAFDAAASPAGVARRQIGSGPPSVRVAIPVRVAGIPHGRELVSERLSAILQAPSAGRWNSGWQARSELAQRSDRSDSGGWLAQEGPNWLGFSVPTDFFERVKDTPASLRVRVAFTLFTSSASTTRSPNPRAYRVPGAGDCTLERILPTREPYLGCVAPFERSAAVGFRVRNAGGNTVWEASGCCVMSYGPLPTVGLFSVWHYNGVMGTGPAQALPGGEVSIEVRRPVSHFERELEIGEIHLARYEVSRTSGR